ncbi:Acyl-CoA synthetase (AMP-forming)/AMP-acid ligase II [Hymenobacter gelipurpurascens]|uniref:Acyl-CoA synthetase (AMP-forming)/AMP-acid ligase II n=1 Tax=Hymenobacter gelipurpurascens TaxID=89968 RepID=A0A212T084_9BACT|nr:AMP-binding protein [Hymenobacter gelipurpurascens]SNC59438.1 Acyl-CoA synthetase (AMP-forming)/AMP-acid ligase II [Hymenobacter gelipurpurascens]
MSANFYELIHANLTAQPGREWVHWPALPGTPAPTPDTGQHLLARIGSVGAHLLRQGVRPGQKVLLALPVGPALLSGLLGLLAVGAIPVLPPAGSTAKSLRKLAQQQGIRVGLVAETVPTWARLLTRLRGLRLLAAPAVEKAVAPALLPQPVLPTQAALISHSSGSTGGSPKTVVRTHAVLRAQHEVLKAAFPPLPGQHDFPLFPNVLLHNLAAGVTSVLPAVPALDVRRLEPAAVVAQLGTGRIHTLTGNVFYFRRLLHYLEQHPAAFPAVVALGIGGSPVPEALLLALQPFFPAARRLVIYGSSEAEPLAIRDAAAAPAPPAAAGYCVGHLRPELTWELRPLGHVRTPAGTWAEVGELAVRGPHVAVTGSEWFLTGDFGYLNDQHQLVLTGRKGNETLVAGVQHYQLEHALSEVCGAERVAACPFAEGFRVYVQGPADLEPALRKVLSQWFPSDLGIEFLFRAELPVDGRHHSKILYSQLA